MNEDRDELKDIDILVSQGIIREIGHNIAADTKTKINTFFRKLVRK